MGTVGSIMGPLLTATMLLLAGCFFLFTMLRRVAPLLALRCVNRLDHPGERIVGLLRFGIGQRRMLDPEEIRPGLMHVVIFSRPPAPPPAGSTTRLRGADHTDE